MHELSHCSCILLCVHESAPYSIHVNIVQTQLQSKRSKYNLNPLLCMLMHAVSIAIETEDREYTLHVHAGGLLNEVCLYS